MQIAFLVPAAVGARYEHGEGIHDEHDELLGDEDEQGRSEVDVDVVDEVDDETVVLLPLHDPGGGDVPAQQKTLVHVGRQRLDAHRHQFAQKDEHGHEEAFVEISHAASDLVSGRQSSFLQFLIADVHPAQDLIEQFLHRNAQIVSSLTFNNKSNKIHLKKIKITLLNQISIKIE